MARFRRLFRLEPRSTAELHADIDEELASLIAARVDDLVAHGYSPDEARSIAAQRLGASLDQTRRQLHQSATLRERRMRLHEHVGDFLQDVRYAARGLARRPSFTVVALATLAIGIGATTAIFSAVNTLLLRPLPFPRPAELMRVSLSTPAVGDRPPIADMSWSYPKARAFQKDQSQFTDIALYAWQPATITSGEPELIRLEYVSGSYLSLLGVVPVAGRDFDRSIDERRDATPHVIISDALWQRRFNGARDVIGKTISLDRKPYTIIGITPPGFLGLTGEGQLLVPVTTQPAEELDAAQSHWLNMVARRKPGLTDAEINTAVSNVARRVNEGFVDDFTQGKPWSGTAKPLDDSRVAPLIKRSLLVLFGAVAFVLLIACVNVANLLVGRASTRRREIAVRLAIGANRGRLVRLLLTESLVLALFGAAASVFVAWAGIHALAAVNPATLRMPRFNGIGTVTFSSISLDWTALAFTLGLSLAVGLAFGLIPALHATRTSLADTMKDGGGSDRARGASISRRMLVVVEVAMALVLLAGSGLMLRSLGKLLSINPGFDTQNVLTLRLTVPPGGLARDSIPGFYSQLTERLAAVPGVTNVGLAQCPPLGGGCNKTLVDLMDRPSIPVQQRPLVEIHWASPSWFATGHVPVRRGRLFTNTDNLAAPKVVLINETAAKLWWPGADPIGKRVGLGQGGFDKGAEIVGVVGDVRQVADSAPMPSMYVSYLQSPRGSVMIFMRTTRDAAAVAPEVRNALRELAPSYPVHDMMPLEERTAAATAQARFSAMLLALFAATALSLAIVGIYGVMSLAVTTRTRELGIRIALGADQGRVRRLVVSEGIALVSIGAAIGLAGALLSTRVLRTLLYDLEPTDPVTYVAIVLLLGGAALLASWIPARRASRVDPVVALRSE